MAYLILIRHGLTDWNSAGRWQGLTDIPLNEEGREQARQAAETIRDIKVDLGFTSVLKRTQQTSEEICNKLGHSCPVFAESALNERDYGIYTGKNKWEVKKELGEKEFSKLRRGWNQKILQGESLKDVYNRVVLFYRQKILPEIKKSKNIMVVSSGNTLRALIKYLENISDKDSTSFELNFGEVRIYQLNDKGKIISKEVRGSDLYKGKH